MIAVTAKIIGYWLLLPVLILGAVLVDRKWAGKFFNPDLLNVDADLYQ